MANEAFDLSEWINLSPVPQSPATTLPESGDRTDAQQYALLENNRSGYLANSVINPQAPEPQDSSSIALVEKATTEQHEVIRPGPFRAIKPKAIPSSAPLEFSISTQSTHGILPKEPRKRRRINLEGDSYRETRHLGSCARCWLRQIKCGHSDPCDQCVKQGISTELCCRTRVKDLINHRPGLATKFIDTYEGSIDHWDHDGEKKKVNLWYGLYSSFIFEVMEYTPRREITDLFWKSPSGWQKLVHTPFGIHSQLDIDPIALDAYTFEQIPLLLDQIERKIQDHRDDAPSTTDVRSNFKGGVLWLRTMRSIHAILEETSSNRQMLRYALLLWAYTFLQYHALWQFTEDTNHDRLGMAQLALGTHDCETLTCFSGATPPPILLRQQIHACIEGRMGSLERSLTLALHKSYVSVSKSAPDADWVTLYLTTWIYLSTLEEIAWDAGRWKNLLNDFDWPLERSPDKNYEYAVHSARTIVAHYQMAIRGEKLEQMYERHFSVGDDTDGEKAQHQIHRDKTMQRLFRDICSFATAETAELDRRKDADFHAEDIRSLEMKFAGMMIS